MSTLNGPQPPAPPCYRHPNHPARIGCNRCGRPICPDCMTVAAVGHQCPDCVAEGQRSVRQVRTAFGGRPTDGRPMLTYILMGACLVMYVAQLAVPATTEQLGLWPPGVAFYDQWYRMVTSMFLHHGVVHLLFNMYALFIVGPALESWLGRTRYGILYGLSGVGGSVLVYLMASMNTLTAGASGAIFGLFAATFVVGKKLKLNVGMVAGLIIANLVLTFSFPGISWQGHVGGLVTGALVALGYAYARPANRNLVQFGVPIALLAVFVALCWWRTTQLWALYA